MTDQLTEQELSEIEELGRAVQEKQDGWPYSKYDSSVECQRDFALACLTDPEILALVPEYAELKVECDRREGLLASRMGDLIRLTSGPFKTYEERIDQLAEAVKDLERVKAFSTLIAIDTDELVFKPQTEGLNIVEWLDWWCEQLESARDAAKEQTDV